MVGLPALQYSDRDNRLHRVLGDCIYFCALDGGADSSAQDSFRALSLGNVAHKNIAGDGGE